MYQCEKCGKDFEYKYLLTKHQNRKFSCETTDNIDSVFEDKIKIIENEIESKTKISLQKKDICMLCETPLSMKTNIKRHINQFCKAKKQLMSNIENIREDKVKFIQQKEIYRNQRRLQIHYNVLGGE